MRRTADRIRHALSFELFALAIITPLGAMVFDTPIKEMGVVTVVSATIATGWNYLYNLMFDHAVLFEAGLLLVLIPFIALYLGVSLWTAFVMDVAFAGFYLIYAFCFNWGYDVIFPVPEPDGPVAGERG